MNTITKQLHAVIENIDYEVSVLANASAFFFMVFEDISWAGFYLLQDEQLILGPFQGKVACTNIAINKGVCGTCASTLQTQRIKNVHEFAGHIACDSASNSEIVIPMIVNQTLYGVLDIDSTSLDRFSEEDQILLEECVHILEAKLTNIVK